MKPFVNLTPLKEDDIAEVARLHRLSFPGFFLSDLGDQFLVQFYRGFVNERSAVAVVAKSGEGRVIGAVVGTTEPTAFFRNLLRRRWAGFGLASLRIMFTRPSTVPRLIRAVGYRGSSAGTPSGALLSSIFVDSTMRGGGLGAKLLLEWSSAAAELGATCAYLTTDADDNENANRFYRNQGWLLADSYRTREGREMNQYGKELASRC